MFVFFSDSSLSVFNVFHDFGLLSPVLPSIGIGALSAREAEGRTNISSGEKVSFSIWLLNCWILSCIIENLSICYLCHLHVISSSLIDGDMGCDKFHTFASPIVSCDKNGKDTNFDGCSIRLHNIYSMIHLIVLSVLPSERLVLIVLYFLQ